MIHVVVPLLNEEGGVSQFIENLRGRLEALACPARLIAVDDGSTDATADICRQASSARLPIEVVSHPRNLGPGAAFRTGFLRVLDRGEAGDLMLTLEGDGTSDLSILPRMLRRAREEGDLVVLASCYLYGGGIVGTDLHRVGLSHLANGLMKKTLGLSGLSTLSSFYRLYSLEAVRRMHERWGDAFIRSPGFECQVEILYRAARLRLPISEVPMVLDNSRRVGRSKMRILRTSLSYLRLSALALRGKL
ncbi:MAG TPA: glycosyltransferase family 2 protein [Vicinamibacteria bacterium]|nr:glycosyltransferase family 2 protein [Vicinamibacteria bacterium]